MNKISEPKLYPDPNYKPIFFKDDSKWINPRDKLPPPMEEVLVVIERAHVDLLEIMYYDPDKDQWCWFDRNHKSYRKRRVLYWMPLPKPPEAFAFAEQPSV